MKLQVGKKYRTGGLVLAGFIIFLGVFLVATQNNSFFKASADTKNLSVADYLPNGYTNTHVNYGNYIDNTDQTSKITLGTEDNNISFSTKSPVSIEVPLGICFNYQSTGNNQYQINTYIMDITQSKGSSDLVDISTFHPTEPFHPDDSTKDLNSGLVSKGSLEFSDTLTGTDLTIHHTFLIYVPTRDCDNSNSKSLYRIGDNWKYNPPTNTASNTSKTTSTNPSLTSTGTGVDFIYITNKTNCPNCANQTTIVNNLKTEFASDVSNKKLTFTNYDYDSHPEIFVTGALKPGVAGGVDKNQLPLIIIKAGSKEVGRYSGYQAPQSQTALAAQIKSALGSSGIPNTGTSSNTSQNSVTKTGQDVFEEVKFDKDGCQTFASAKVKPEYLTGSDPVVNVIFEVQGQTKIVPVNPDGSAKTTFNINCEENSTKEKDGTITTYNSNLTKIILTKAYAQNTSGNKATAQTKSQKNIGSQTVNTSSTGSSTTSQNNLNNDGFGTQGLFNALAGLSQDQANGDAQGNIYARVASVINLLLAIASAAMVFGIVWSGLLMISSMGNEEQAKKAKSNLVMLIIGLFILLASFTIVGLIQNILKGTGISG